MAVTNAITDLFSSFYELLASIVSTVYGLIMTFVMAIVNFVTSIFSLVGDVFRGVYDVAGGVGKFLVGNAVLVLIVAVGGFLFLKFQQQQQGNAKPMKPQSAIKKNT